MAGRGRGLTVPAWMQDPSLVKAAFESPSTSVSNGGGGVQGKAEPPHRIVASSAPAKVQEQTWVEYTTEEGRKYYHNKETNETTWEKPAEYLSPAEKALGTCSWEEYKDDQGRPYYYNKETQKSEWTMPEEYRMFVEKKQRVQDAAEAPAVVATPVEDAANIAPSVHHSKEDVEATPVPEAVQMPSVSSLLQTAKQTIESKSGELPERYHHSSPARKAFYELLFEKGVEPHMPWEEAMQLVIADPRYKNAFRDYCAIREKEVEEAREDKERSLRENYITLLKEHPEIGPESGLPRDRQTRIVSHYRAAVPALEADPRFRAIPCVEQRELWFEQYLFEMEAEERRKEEEARSKHMAELRAAFEGDGKLDAFSQWRRVRLRYEDHVAFQALSPVDCLLVYEEVMKAKVEQEEERERLDRLEQRKQERKNREAFRQLLREKHEERKFHLRTPWSKFLDEVKHLPLYDSVKKQQGYAGSAPHELYDDILEELETAYEPDRAILKKAFESAELEVLSASEMNFKEFKSRLTSTSAVSDINEEHIEVFYDDIQYKARHKRESEARKKEKREKKFTELLQSGRLQHRISVDTTWESVEAELDEHSAGKKITDGARKKELFEEYKESLKNKADDSEEEEGMVVEDKDYRRSHRRSRSPRRSESRDRRGKRGRDSDDEDGYRSKRRRTSRSR